MVNLNPSLRLITTPPLLNLLYSISFIIQSFLLLFVKYFLWKNFSYFKNLRSVFKSCSYIFQFELSRVPVPVPPKNFSIGCRYFLQKRKLPVQTKTLLFIASIFLVVIFLFLCDIVAICLCLTYRVIMV